MISTLNWRQACAYRAARVTSAVGLEVAPARPICGGCQVKWQYPGVAVRQLASGPNS
jgi:hypothetical protein